MDLRTLTLDELICRAQGGDRQAAGQLLRRVRPLLHTLLQSQVGEALARRNDLEDLAQVAWLEVLRRLPEFEPRGPSAFLSWCRRLALSRIQDLARSQQVRRGTLESDLGHPLEELSDVLTTPPYDPVQAERVAHVARALRQLTPEQAEAVRLVRLEGWYYREAAERMGLSIPTFRVRLRQAEARLALLLARHRLDGDG